MASPVVQIRQPRAHRLSKGIGRSQVDVVLGVLDGDDGATFTHTLGEIGEAAIRDALEAVYARWRDRGGDPPQSRTSSSTSGPTWTIRTEWTVRSAVSCDCAIAGASNSPESRHGTARDATHSDTGRPGA